MCTGCIELKYVKQSEKENMVLGIRSGFKGNKKINIQEKKKERTKIDSGRSRG